MNQAGSGQSSVADAHGFRTGGLAGLPRDKDSNDEEHSLSRGAVEIGSDTALHWVLRKTLRQQIRKIWLGTRV